MPDTNQRKFHSICKVVMLSVFTLIAVWHGIVIPAGEGVDETPHLQYVLYIKDHRALPIQPEVIEDVQVWMGHHPPLYYLLSSLAISWIDTSDFSQVFQANPHFVWVENSVVNGWNVMLHYGQDAYPWNGSVLALHIIRFLTIIMGMIALDAIYNGNQLLFHSHRWAPLTATALIAFNPSFVFMSSTVHHDTLQVMLFALATWWAIAYLNGFTHRENAWLGGILAGAALLTKLSGFVLVATIAGVIVLKHWCQRNWVQMISQLFQFAAVVAIIAGWWYVRNWLLYGDPLGWSMFLNIHRHMVRTSPYTWGVFIHEFLGQIGRTYWGAYGYMHITFPNITCYFWWLCAIACVGLLLGVVRHRSAGKAFWYTWAIVVMVPLLLFASFVRFSFATIGAGHGRYLFPAALSTTALITAGLNQFFRWRHQQVIAIAVAAGMAAFAVYLPLCQVLPKYAYPTTASQVEIQSLTQTNIQVANGVELAGYHLTSGRVFPGQWLPVDLYWKATETQNDIADPKVRLELVDENGNSLYVSETVWLVPSLPPRFWDKNAIYMNRIIVGSPTGDLPGELNLVLATFDAGQQSETGERTVLGKLITTGGAELVNRQDVPINRQEIFASSLRLLGYEISTKEVKAGDTFLVNLYWETMITPAVDCTVFIHLLDSSGVLITQYDRPAGGNMMPTSSWQPGQVLRDSYPVTIPDDTPAGSYLIRMGMYTWPSMERTPISIDGALLADDYIDLGTVTVVH